MDKQILGLIVGSDEPETLLVTKPLHRPSSHCVHPPSICAANAESAQNTRISAGLDGPRVPAGASGFTKDGRRDRRRRPELALLLRVGRPQKQQAPLGG